MPPPPGKGWLSVRLQDGTRGQIQEACLDRPGFVMVQVAEGHWRAVCVTEFRAPETIDLERVAKDLGFAADEGTLCRRICVLAQRNQNREALWLYVTARLLEKLDRHAEFDARTALVAGRVNDPDREYNRLARSEASRPIKKAPAARGLLIATNPSSSSPSDPAEQIVKLLSEFRFEEADALFEQSSSRLSRTWYQSRRAKAEHRSVTSQHISPTPVLPEHVATERLVQDGGRVQRTLELLLFDLDDTLVQTGDLENFRGVAHVGPQTDEYDQRLKRAFVSTTARNLYSARQLADLRQRWPALKVGIFTRAPRHYTDIVLKLAFPETTWDVVVSFEDVRRTKPDGEGVGHAMKACGIRSSSSVAIVGDGKSDVQAAYNGGCWIFLDRGSWPPKLRREDWWALERVPDAVIQDPNRLIEVLACPEAELPELERVFSSAAGSAHHRPRFDRINHFNPLDAPGRTYGIHVAGRIFNHHPSLQARAAWHPVSQEILANKSADQFSPEWVETIRRFLRRQQQLRAGSDVLVTVVPFKPGRVPRLENLLRQVEMSHAQRPILEGVNVTFVMDVLAYKAGVQSHSASHLDKESRFQNVRDHLFVRRPEVVNSMHVVVVDDVVTTGASLIYAHDCLMAAGASRVTCFAFTKAVGNT